jgi:hypothetical protein
VEEILAFMTLGVIVKAMSMVILVPYTKSLTLQRKLISSHKPLAYRNDYVEDRSSYNSHYNEQPSYHNYRETSNSSRGSNNSRGYSSVEDIPLEAMVNKIRLLWFIYTDGASSNNGQNHARAGYGV